MTTTRLPVSSSANLVRKLRPSCSSTHDRFPVVLKIPFRHAMKFVLFLSNGSRLISQIFHFNFKLYAHDFAPTTNLGFIGISLVVEQVDHDYIQFIFLLP